MRTTPWAAAAALTLFGSIALAATNVAAQSGAQTSPSAGSPDVVQGPINATGDQAQTLLESLASFVEQTLPSDFQPSVGAPVPQGVSLQPMPPAGQQAVPDAADHHVAKTDDNTIMIVDPVTRQIVGLITGDDLDGAGGNANAPGMTAPGATPAPATPGSGTPQ